MATSGEKDTAIAGHPDQLAKLWRAIPNVRLGRAKGGQAEQHLEQMWDMNEPAWDILLSRKDAANRGYHFAIQPNHHLLEKEEEELPDEFPEFYRVAVTPDNGNQGQHHAAPLEMTVFALGTLSVPYLGTVPLEDNRPGIKNQKPYLETGYSVVVNLADYSVWILDTEHYVSSVLTKDGEFLDGQVCTGAVPAPYSPTTGREAAAKILDSVKELGVKDMLAVTRTIKDTSCYGLLRWGPCSDADLHRLITRAKRTSALSSSSEGTQDSQASSHRSSRSSFDSMEKEKEKPGAAGNLDSIEEF